MTFDLSVRLWLFHACQTACVHRNQSVGSHCVYVSSGLIREAHPQTSTYSLFLPSCLFISFYGFFIQLFISLVLCFPHIWCPYNEDFFYLTKYPPVRTEHNGLKSQWGHSLHDIRGYFLSPRKILQSF